METPFSIGSGTKPADSMNIVMLDFLYRLYVKILCLNLYTKTPCGLYFKDSIEGLDEACQCILPTQIHNAQIR